MAINLKQVRVNASDVVLVKYDIGDEIRRIKKGECYLHPDGYVEKWSGNSETIGMYLVVVPKSEPLNLKFPESLMRIDCKGIYMSQTGVWYHSNCKPEIRDDKWCLHDFIKPIFYEYPDLPVVDKSRWRETWIEKPKQVEPLKLVFPLSLMEVDCAGICMDRYGKWWYVDRQPRIDENAKICIGGIWVIGSWDWQENCGAVDSKLMPEIGTDRWRETWIPKPPSEMTPIELISRDGTVDSGLKFPASLLSVPCAGILMDSRGCWKAVLKKPRIVEGVTREYWDGYECSTNLSQTVTGKISEYESPPFFPDLPVLDKSKWKESWIPKPAVEDKCNKQALEGGGGADNLFQSWTCIFPDSRNLSWKRVWDSEGTKEDAEVIAADCDVVAVPLQLFEKMKEHERRMVEAERKLALWNRLENDSMEAVGVDSDDPVKPVAKINKEIDTATATEEIVKEAVMFAAARIRLGGTGEVRFERKVYVNGQTIETNIVCNHETPLEHEQVGRVMNWLDNAIHVNPNHPANQVKREGV